MAALVQQVHSPQLVCRCFLVCLEAFAHTTVNLLLFPASWTATFLEIAPSLFPHKAGTEDP